MAEVDSYESSQKLLQEEEDNPSLKSTCYGSVDTTLGSSGSRLPQRKPLPRVSECVSTSSNSDDYSSPEPDESGVLLQLCRKKILEPYSLAISVVGWSPLLNADFGRTTLKRVFNKAYIVLLVTLVLFGHVFEYASCFRRDGFALYRESYVNHIMTKNSTLFYQRTIWDVVINFFAPIDDGHASNKSINETFSEPIYAVVCSGGVLSTYLIPSILHTWAFFYMIFIMRWRDNERLTQFVEIVFLQIRNLPDGKVKEVVLVKQLRRKFLWFVGWMVAPLCSFTLQFIYGKMSPTSVNYTWMQPKDIGGIIILDTLLIICMILNYVVCVSIAISYIFQCELLIIYLTNLRYMVKLRIIDLADFYKRINDVNVFLKHLNRYQSLGVGLISLNVATKFITALYGFISGESMISDSLLVYCSTVIMICYWMSLVYSPINNARLVCHASEELKDLCYSVKGTTHSGNFRPSDSEVDTLILYMSTLKIDARIFSIPLHSKSVMKVVLIIFIVLLVLGQLGLTYFSSF